jgi:hypothetical protein
LFALFRQRQFMTALAIASAVPHVSLAWFLHPKMQNMIRVCDPHIRQPKSYNAIRRAMGQLKGKVEKGILNVLSQLKSDICFTFDLWYD